MPHPNSTTLDPARAAHEAQWLDQRADALGDQLTGLRGSVEGMLASWSGSAADRFRHLWEEWDTSANAVHTSLVGTIAGVRAAHADLAHADDAARERSRLLASRLG